MKFLPHQNHFEFFFSHNISFYLPLFAKILIILPSLYVRKGYAFVAKI